MASDPFRLGGEMKVLMKRRFVPNHYYRDLYLKLQGLNQGYMTVDEFFFGKLTYVLKENIMGIPKIYNENRNETNNGYRLAT